MSMVASVVADAVPPSAGPTVQDVVQFTRIVHPRYQDNDLLQQQISPSGERAFIVTRRSDVRNDGVHYELVLLDMNVDRLLAAQPALPQVILRVEAGRAHDDDGMRAAFVQDVSWIGEHTIVLRARLHDGPYQVFKLDVTTRRLTQLTFDPRGILSFAVSNDLRRVVYAVQTPNPPMSAGAHSVVAGNQRFWSVMFGRDDVRFQIRRYAFFATESGSQKHPQQLGDSVQEVGAAAPRVSLSPDGRWAILPIPAPERQAEWVQEYPFVKQQAADYGPSATRDPLHYFSSESFWVPRRMVAYRLSDGHAQVVIDAPDDARTGAAQQRVDRLWRKDGKSLLLAGTLLPVAHGIEGALRDASPIIEYWPDTQRWRLVGTLKQRLGGAFFVPASDDRLAVLDGSTRRSFRRLADGAWQELNESTSSADATPDLKARGAHWTLGIDQGLNRPPDVMAIGPAGQSVQLTRLNPEFSAQTWGTMRPYSWQDAKGRRWDGGLMVPANFDPHVRHALVIQTYGFDPNRFYLDGSNIADGFGSGFAGRAFMRENILVLAMPTDPSMQRPKDERLRTLIFSDGVESAIRDLVNEGVVDRDRVGIIGWSMTGEHVLNLVTFSDAPIRAATLLDGDANTLFAATVTYGLNDELQFRKESTNEGPPFGKTLANWIRNDPSMHTDCIHAALRIETYGPTVNSNWDIYAWLRRQYKAAEMIVAPYGTHALGQPSERMISLQGNVDWYRFWLRGEERTDALLTDETPGTLRLQYERWRQMAELKRLDDARPHCPLRPASP